MLSFLKKISSNWLNRHMGPKKIKKSYCVNDSNILNRVWTDPVYFIAFGFGSGLFKKAPGTFGTLAAIPIYFLINNTAPLVYLGIVIILFVLGVFVANKISNELGVHDHQGIVIDEIVGYLLVMFLVPSQIYLVFLGFVFFRLFDIWKPEPIGWLDRRVKGGFGIMLDDFIAAIFAWIVLQLIILVINL